MNDDALRRRIANETRLAMVVEDGETTQWSVSAMCLELGNGPENEGYLTLTDRRLLFYSDAADSLLPPAPVIGYSEITRLRVKRGPMKTAMVIITLNNAREWHFVTGRGTVKQMKKLARRAQAVLPSS